MKTYKLVLVGTVAGIVLCFAVGCGGSSAPGTLGSNEAKGPGIITSPPTWEQVAAAHAAVGKPIPAFLQSGALPSGDSVSNLMEQLTLRVWKYDRRLPYDGVFGGGRVSWFECPLLDEDYPTDCTIVMDYGDADLYVFAPFTYTKAYGTREPRDLELIGWSIKGPGFQDHVGSFYPRDYGGPGRFICAVYGGRTQFDIRCW